MATWREAAYLVRGSRWASSCSRSSWPSCRSGSGCWWPSSGSRSCSAPPTSTAGSRTRSAGARASSCASASAGGTGTGRAAGSGTACESWRPTRRRGRTRGSWCSAWSARVRGAGPDHRRVLAVLAVLAYLREARW